MSELVERLRALVILDEVRSVNTLGKEAADRIEALEAALREIQQRAVGNPPARHTWYYDVAQAALAPEPDK